MKNLSVKYSLISVFSFVTNVIIVLLLFENHKKSIESPIYATLLSQLLTFIILVLINIKDINLLKVDPPTKEFSILFKFRGFPSIIASIAIMLGEWGDLFIIDNYLTRSDLGVYSFGFKIAAVYIVIIASPFYLVWNPFFMRYMNHANIRQICSSVVCYYYYISILFIFLTQIFSTKILKLINVSDNFIESCYLIPLLMSAFFISSLQNLYSIGFF